MVFIVSLADASIRVAYSGAIQPIHIDLYLDITDSLTIGNDKEKHKNHTKHNILHRNEKTPLGSLVITPQKKKKTHLQPCFRTDFDKINRNSDEYISKQIVQTQVRKLLESTRFFYVYFADGTPADKKTNLVYQLHITIKSCRGGVHVSAKLYKGNFASKAAIINLSGPRDKISSIVSQLCDEVFKLLTGTEYNIFRQKIVYTAHLDLRSNAIATSTQNKSIYSRGNKNSTDSKSHATHTSLYRGTEMVIVESRYDGSGFKKLAGGGREHCYYAAVQGDKLGYISKYNYAHYVNVKNIDSGVTVFRRKFTGSLPIGFVFSPLNNNVFTMSIYEQKFGARLYTVDVGHKQFTSVTENKDRSCLDLYPHLSRESNLLVFSSDRGNKKFNIYSLNLHSGKILRITNSFSGYHFPVLSPNGRFVACIKGSGQAQILCIIDLEQNNKEVEIWRTAKDSISLDSVSWHDSGMFLIMSGQNRSHRFQLYLLNVLMPQYGPVLIETPCQASSVSWQRK
jgi:Tol biopolymer transport system component